MLRDIASALEDILEAIERIGRYTSGSSRALLQADVKSLDAVLRNIEVIGEVAKQLPDGVREQHPEIEWEKIIALGEAVLDRYFAVDVDLVWDVIQNDLPVLKPKLQEILDR